MLVTSDYKCYRFKPYKDEKSVTYCNQCGRYYVKRRKTLDGLCAISL